MNANHAQLCPSPEWASFLREEVLDRLVSRVDLGGHLLEIGPGPGAATAYLCERVDRLTALELDDDAAGQLRRRYAGTSVEVVTGDATAMTFEEGTFDSVGTFTMLHHVPTARLQNRVLAEAFRVLRPGGVLVGSDSRASDDLHQFHEGDTYNPIEAASLLPWLEALGYHRITVSTDGVLSFVAYKPDEDAPDDCGQGAATTRSHEPGAEGSDGDEAATSGRSTGGPATGRPTAP